MHKYISRIALALLTCSAAAHATIYQCGSTFQGHPCAGAIVRSGSPTTNDDQSGARYAQMEAQDRRSAQKNHSSTANASACITAQRTYERCKSIMDTVSKEKAEARKLQGSHTAVIGTPPAEVDSAERCMASATVEIGEYCKSR